MQIIDEQRAIALMEQAVAARGPDYVYDGDKYGSFGCRYWAADEPACIVGLALSYAGWPARDIADLDTSGDMGDVIAADDLHRYYPERVTEAAARVFGQAQRTQDNACPWSVALDRAKEAVGQQS